MDCFQRNINFYSSRTKWWNNKIKTLVKENKRAWKRYLQTKSRKDIDEYH